MNRSFLLLALAALVGCSDSDVTACEAERAFLATHSACSTQADCVIVGSCSGGFGFAAVQRSARDEAQSLSDSTSCGRVFDGPLYSASCVAGQCSAVATGGYCGTPTLDAYVPLDAKVDATLDATSDATLVGDASPDARP